LENICELSCECIAIQEPDIKSQNNNPK
jgi:hypothetical protein